MHAGDTALPPLADRCTSHAELWACHHITCAKLSALCMVFDYKNSRQEE